MPLRKRSSPFNHPDWILEAKLEGFRAIAVIEHGRTKLYSPNGHHLLPSLHWQNQSPAPCPTRGLSLTERFARSINEEDRNSKFSYPVPTNGAVHGDLLILYGWHMFPFLRLVPSVIAIDTGLVIIDPQLGHLNLSVISIEHHFTCDACNWVLHRAKMLDQRVEKSED